MPTIDPVDAVLISHLHMDHLHLRSLRTVTNGVRVIAPAGSAKLFRSLGVTQLDEVVAGDVVTLRAATGDTPAIEAQVVPADHSNARGPHSRIVAEPVGYVLHTGNRSVYFAGDTDLFEEMHDFPDDRRRPAADLGLGPDARRSPPRPGPGSDRHALDRLPGSVVPIHWGTYTPITPRRGTPAWIDNPFDAFTAALAELDLADRLVALRPGETMTTGAVRIS